MTITNYELRIANLAQIFVVLCLFCAFAGNSFAQIQNPERPSTNDFIIDAIELEFIDFRATIEDGTVEAKRDVLLEIRNLELAEASRIAVPALRDSSEIVRATAAFSVIFLPKEEAAQALLPLLSDKSEFVRRETAYALGKVRNPAAAGPLVQVLQKDKILEVRSAAAIALGEIGDAGAVDALTQVLRRKLKDEEEFLRRSAARSIGQIAQIILSGETEVITPADFSLPKSESNKPERANLAETFPNFRAAVGVLIQTLQNPKESQDVKREAAFALGAIGDDAAIPVLQANVNNADYYLAEICKEALRKISA